MSGLVSFLDSNQTSASLTVFYPCIKQIKLSAVLEGQKRPVQHLKHLL